jgi:alcohol dehydrogenase
VVILDPELATSQPPRVLAVTGYDAISHAVESYVSTKRSALSQCFAREAWRLLSGNYERALACEDDVEAMASMQLGAFYAGLAVENSMLGAAHACANPLTQRYGTTHGVAIAAMLPAVAEWNAGVSGAGYRDLDEDVPGRLREMARSGGLSASLREMGVPREELSSLAVNAAEQWTGRFNPRPFDAAAALELYERAW